MGLTACTDPQCLYKAAQYLDLFLPIQATYPTKQYHDNSATTRTPDNIYVTNLIDV
jgi:hypothetical protein